ncbi:MAG: DNA internalization-related competence protein ComEC/Rec2, partial [Betaproteobacteria bacterium]
MGRALGLLCVLVASYALMLPALPNLAILSQMTIGWLGAVLLCGFSLDAASTRFHIQLSDCEWLPYCKRVVVLVAVGLVMATWVVWRADLRLQDRLDPALESVVTRVVFRIESMVRDQSDSMRFDARILEPIPAGVPRHIEVSWRAGVDAERREIMPGQVWRAALILRSPRGLVNPHGFDYEGHAFARNVRALGRVRGVPNWQRDESWGSLSVVVGRARQTLRARMRQSLDQKRYAAVLIALAIGDQDSVRPEHWRVFNLTGITHLVSISGSHVTMIAAMGGWLMLIVGRRLRFRQRALCEWIPARVLAAFASAMVGLGYCLLAGWGVPARRTFFMLLVVCVALMLRLPVSMSGVLCFAACALVVIDPWAPLATGFWLSFGAVAVLFSAAQVTLARSDAQGVWSRLWIGLCEATRLQWLITIAMTPPLAFLFQQVSLSSPFANALAIPIVSFIVTPLALLVALLSVLPNVDLITSWLAVLAHTALHGVLIPITWLGQAPWSALDVAAMPWVWLVVSLAGAVWALAPQGTPVRWTGWFLMLPALAWQPERPTHGEWTMTVMDVGQGAAILVRTARHSLLFDVGPTMGHTDAGQRIIIPLLRALGVRAIDAVVLSHADLDHTGGLESIYAERVIPLSYASFDVMGLLQERVRRRRVRSHLRHSEGNDPADSEPSFLRNLHVQRCESGVTWRWDGVTFAFLHPGQTLHIVGAVHKVGKEASKVRTNAQSCVLKISGSHHTVLLPGDLPAQQERRLAIQQGKLLDADVVVMAHHGSATSSS